MIKKILLALSLIAVQAQASEITPITTLKYKDVDINIVDCSKWDPEQTERIQTVRMQFRTTKASLLAFFRNVPSDAKVTNLMAALYPSLPNYTSSYTFFQTEIKDKDNADTPVSIMLPNLSLGLYELANNSLIVVAPKQNHPNVVHGSYWPNPNVYVNFDQNIALPVDHTTFLGAAVQRDIALAKLDNTPTPFLRKLKIAYEKAESEKHNTKPAIPTAIPDKSSKPSSEALPVVW